MQRLTLCLSRHQKQILQQNVTAHSVASLQCFFHAWTKDARDVHLASFFIRNLDTRGTQCCGSILHAVMMVIVAIEVGQFIVDILSTRRNRVSLWLIWDVRGTNY
jgi:hypothetical protein